MTGCRDIWLVRHGRTPSNAARVIQGQIDAPLDQLGVAQAEALGRWLMAEGITFGAAFSSPLRRAAHTADLAVAGLGLSVERVPGLMERSFGALEGQPADQAWAEQERFDGHPYDFRPGGGESSREMADRAWGAFEQVASTEVERLLVVSHGGPIGAIICRALGIPYEPDIVRRIRRDNTGITRLKRRTVGWTADAINARPHLSWDGGPLDRPML
jgi:broad specificity phosphatase PhoE